MLQASTLGLEYLGHKYCGQCFGGGGYEDYVPSMSLW